MSTLIQFRLSGEDEQTLLDAARVAGLRPADYVRQSAKLAANRPDTALERIEQRLAALEAKLGTPTVAPAHTFGQDALVRGMEVTDFLTEVRREVRAGVSAILMLLDGEPLPEIPHRRTPSDKSD